MFVLGIGFPHDVAAIKQAIIAPRTLRPMLALSNSGWTPSTDATRLSYLQASGDGLSSTATTSGVSAVDQIG